MQKTIEVVYEEGVLFIDSSVFIDFLEGKERAKVLLKDYLGNFLEVVMSE